ncbi:type IV pilus assembly protein PilM [Cryobacterium luteum]|uniref:Type IV pilus assembly protein PilM n=1 Tax=Cryobacterium luteum TaxID=1424661 RepID=A0A1H8C0R9_9MICO|nr:type IV pilus assembly protein PilM [Cryobacterium luteum]TFB89208.1 type IV pilus assembly protein PilM [Cryobacterium luteum]SEM88705.1 type IV pilus assembly protein PilM [Cryobacterium luteum]
MRSRVVGIDIGTSTVRAVELSGADTDTPTLLHYFEEPLPVGAVFRGEVIDVEIVAAALKRMWGADKFSSRDVVVGMGNSRVVARNLSVPSMSMRRIRESLPFQVQDLLSFPVNDALLDFYPISETAGEGDSGPQIKGLLIAAAKDVVAANLKVAKAAKLSAIAVDLMPFALSRAITHGTNTDRVIAQIDVGSGKTSVVITDGGIPQFVRLLPAGGNDLTKALKTQLGIDEEAAESLKRTVGLTRSPEPDQEEAASIIREVTYDLLEGLRNTLSYFSNSRLDLTVTQIVLTGGGTHLLGFDAALSELAKLPIVFADPTGIGVGSELDPVALRATQSTFLVAVGLALGSRVGVSLETKIGGEPRADLMPPEVAAGRHAKGLRRRLAVAVGVVLAAVLVGMLFVASLAGTGTADLKIAQHRTALLHGEENQFYELNKAENDLAKSNAAHEIAVAEQIDWQEQLGAVTDALPAGVTIDSVTVSTATTDAGIETDVVVPTDAVATVEMNLTSPTLPSIPAWLDAMNGLVGFVDASPGAMSRSETGTYSATLTLHLNDAIYVSNAEESEK